MWAPGVTGSPGSPLDATSGLERALQAGAVALHLRPRGVADAFLRLCLAKTPSDREIASLNGKESPDPPTRGQDGKL